MCDYSDLQNNNEDNNIFNSIDFDDLDIAFLDGFFDPQTPPPIPSSLSPSPCLADIEQLLMNDDYTTNNNDNDNDNDETFIIDDFLVDCLLDVPLDNNNCGGDVFESNPESNLSDNGEKIDLFDAVVVCESGGEVGVSNEVESNPDSNVSDNGESEKDKCDAFASNGDEDDALRKKRRRQIRNRDSALKSRERRKMYVTDLEAKSKYFEAECIRLQRVLQGCVAENHALHLQLQKDNAVRVFMAKQESAVLLLESLLLGSLLWLMGIILFTPLLLLHPTLPANMLVNVGNDNLEVVLLRGARSELTGSRSFLLSKRCKASRSRMRCMPVSHEAFA